MKLQLESTMFCSAMTYALSQTMLFAQLKMVFSILSILLFLPCPLAVVLKHASARAHFAKPWFVASFASAMAFTLAFNEFDKVGIEALKLIAMTLATGLLAHESGRRAIEAYASGALLTTTAIVLLSYVGVVPNEISTAFDSWTKSYGGFSNPNNGPYFLYVAAVLFFFVGENIKLLMTTVVMLAVFAIDVYSRTYLAGTVVLLLWAFFIIKSGALRTLATAGFVTFGMVVMLIGIVFYAGVVLAPDFFGQFAGSLLDIVTSFRISVALDEPVQSGATVVGFTIKKLDSMYTEIIFYCGPLCALLFFSKLFTLRLRHLREGANNRTIVTYTLLLMMGMFETQLFNLTPIGVIIASLMYTPRSIHTINLARPAAA